MCDFGCGVGRLTLPFADCFDNVVGVDISPAMLAEGEKIADEIGKKISDGFRVTTILHKLMGILILCTHILFYSISMLNGGWD